MTDCVQHQIKYQDTYWECINCCDQFVYAVPPGHPELDVTLPLVLYFGNENDRDEMISSVLEAKPNMVVHKVSRR